MIHTHLNQSTNPSHARGQINTTRSGDSTTVSVGFVLPSLAPSHNSNQSNLPPSCEAGSPYVDPWGRLYMQPLIQYSLQATLRYRLPGETAVQTASASRRIRVTTAPQDEPPSYAESSLERKSVTANADVRRGRFSRPFAKLRIAMEEPPPVVGRSGGGGFGTVGRLRLGWETASKAYDEFESGERRVRIEYFLESRTRWRTSVRETDLNEPRADTNERTETRQLGKFEIRASDRDDVSLDVDETDARSHSGTIPIPIDVVGGAVPTFSHQLCSRHYAVVVKAKVNGMQHTELALRVPLQICESHPTDGEGMAPAKINECEDNFAQEVSASISRRIS